MCLAKTKIFEITLVMDYIEKNDQDLDNFSKYDFSGRVFLTSSGFSLSQIPFEVAKFNPIRGGVFLPPKGYLTKTKPRWG